MLCPPLPSTNATIVQTDDEIQSYEMYVMYVMGDSTASSSYPFGSSVNYTCGRGHTIKGRSEISCDVIAVTEDGTSANWSDAPPVCVGESNSIYRPNVVTNWHTILDICIPQQEIRIEDTRFLQIM